MIDLLISGGEIYDGLGGPPMKGDVAVHDDEIVAVSAVDPNEEVRTRVDATGKAVAPGFINMLSHSHISLLHDGRSLSELLQGVTTEVVGEGTSMGPLTPPVAEELRRGSNLPLEVTWTRLSEYLAYAERSGISQNLASFVGAATLRACVLGYEDRSATPAELDTMVGLLAEEMADGALGVGSALIYPPGSYADTEELTTLCVEAGRHGGMYISHIRNEGPRLLSAVDELVEICRAAECRGEVYHLKAVGRPNWPLLPQAIDRIEQARAVGVAVTADVYPYTATSTGLNSGIPDEYHQGGSNALYDRLADASQRKEIARQMRAEGRWSDPDSVVVLGVRSPELKDLQGRSLREIAQEWGLDPVAAGVELIARDRSRVSCAFFSLSEENLRLVLSQPWVSVGSDGVSMAPEGAFLQESTHPRAYGTFARVLGRYVREEHVLTLSEAIRRMTSHPAQTLGLNDRGRLAPGSKADIVVFDPAAVEERATFEEPHHLAAGPSEVVVNGQVAVLGGKYTGVLAGRALRGPGASHR